MTVEEVSKYAAQDTAPLEMNLPEKLLWFQLRDLYRDFRAGTVTKEQGEKQKQEAISEYNKNAYRDELYHKYMLANANIWIRIEEKAKTYRENPTIENADAFLNAVYGVTFRELISDKWKEGGDSISDSAPPAQTTKTKV